MCFVVVSVTANGVPRRIFGGKGGQAPPPLSVSEFVLDSSKSVPSVPTVCHSLHGIPYFQRGYEHVLQVEGSVRQTGQVHRNSNESTDSRELLVNLLTSTSKYYYKLTNASQPYKIRTLKCQLSKLVFLETIGPYTSRLGRRGHTGSYWRRRDGWVLCSYSYTAFETTISWWVP